MGFIEKKGHVPKVLYFITFASKKSDSLDYKSLAPESCMESIEKNYAYLSPLGYMAGLDGFIYRFEQKVLSNLSNTKSKKITKGEFEDKVKKAFIKECENYLNVRDEANQFVDKNGLIDATKRVQKLTPNQCFLNKIFYSDFYSIEKYGKTVLGCLVHKSKLGDQSASPFISSLFDHTHHHLDQIVEKEKIDCIAFVPHSIQRKVQLLDQYEKQWAQPLQKIKVFKLFKNEVTPQKSLSSLAERIINARESNFIETTDLLAYKKILLIDDALGSGATMNQIAEKLIKINPKLVIIAYAFVGSYKGFEVITEI
jgi:predicted amidophosphoribosyltransferase